jgi:hypothetical protein
MLLIVIAAIVLGAAVAGVVLMFFQVLGRKPGKGIIPLAVGGAMLGFVIWNDYSWFDRTQAALPSSFAVAASYRATNAFAPWTLLAAPVDRFAAIDADAVLQRPDAPDLRLVEVHLITRHRSTASVRQIHDCAQARRLDVTDDAALAAEPDAAWVKLAADDPLHAAVCAAAAPA